VLIAFASPRTTAHADIFDRSAKAGFFVAFEVSQRNKDIRIHDGAADIGFLAIDAIMNRNGNVIGAFESHRR
jgi:hypothetical protein